MRSLGRRGPRGPGRGGYGGPGPEAAAAGRPLRRARRVAERRRRGRRAPRAHPRRPGRDRAARAGPRVRGPVARRDGPGVRLLPPPAARPVPRGDRRGLRAEGLASWEDPHNDDPAFARSRVRREVLPVLERELGPGVAEALARTAALLREDAAALDALAGRRAAAADGDGLRVDGSAAGRRRCAGGCCARAALAAGAPAGELFARARRGGRRAGHRLARAGGWWTCPAT